jgi:guanylate kinase
MTSNSHQFGFTTSHTTRLPREGEIHTVHYNFVTANEMQQLIQKGAFLEHAQVHGNVYGTSWDSLWQVQHRGLRCLLDIDVQGVKRIKSLQQQQQLEQQLEQQSPEATKTSFSPKYIFIAPPSLDLLEQRLISRGTEDEDSLKRRTKNAREEVEYGLQKGNFDYVLVNDDLDKACAEFDAVVKEMYALR